MKLNKLFLGAIAALASAAMVACSDDAPDVNNGGENGDADARYLSVSIVSTPESGSRAAGDQTTGDPNNGATYEEGTAEENKVNKVRFYFFSEGGNPVIVKAGKSESFYDWTPAAQGTKPDDANLDRELNAILIINTKDGDKLPAQVIAVINPDEIDGLDKTTNYSRANLRKVICDFAALANAENPVFPMANSVYANQALTEVIRATALTVDKFKSSEAAAIADPVYIYVERNVAKIRTKLATGLVDANNRLAAVDADGNTVTIEGQQVYIQVMGWNITNTLPNANLSKHIDITWGRNMLGTNTTWNWAPYYRSFWASKNTGIGTGEDQSLNKRIAYDSYDDLTFGNAIYANENADKENNAEIKDTQVVMAAKLCTADGTELNICEYAGQRMVDNANHTSLKNLLLTYLRNENNHYYTRTEETGTDGTTKYTYTEISADDITFETVKNVNPNADANLYSVYAQLTTVAAGKTWYTSNTTDAATTTATVINQALRDLRTAQIYNSGMTYYFAPIKHFTLDGLVRNHIYDLTVNSIVGLGTPVYDPTETIIPETPKTEDSYIAAQIRILSWRVMSQNVNFGE